MSQGLRDLERKLGEPPLISALVWRASAVGPRLRAFARIATDVLRAPAPARSRGDGSLPSRPIVARH